MKARRISKARDVIDRMVLPPSAWKRLPGGPDEALEARLRQWLACGVYAQERKIEIGLASAEVDALWCGFIMSTARYGRFSRTAYEAFLHRRPRGEETKDGAGGTVWVASTAVAGRVVDLLPEPVPAELALANTGRAFEAVARRGEAFLL